MDQVLKQDSDGNYYLESPTFWMPPQQQGQSPKWESLNMADQIEQLRQRVDRLEKFLVIE